MQAKHTQIHAIIPHLKLSLNNMFLNNLSLNNLHQTIFTPFPDFYSFFSINL